ncbi:UDP-N-acetylmuramoylalanyl-D-glutamate--2,6-diaminopimelate ligase [Atopostipes suicloacalis DSM 15692]|uniref:UDP-N-acetylmuramoyl-L-alanyl-D-glutamate--2,6-diaminopimelate ligase n=1 Tax=Atopostipes suicloacalis DSM 15692 TaxID=1121025 RepID=A0A1M4SJS4_9LACT|nr:UDP-N-acetylmuramoyl-L-alanyl-D-glutamate--2,6-diaminopimelate ligase [Atopostipes suicloacalis]SHE32460.1 UDP-N-acetylmuramoylalanyl-D-glutamate--2,6-diaminopimelate ligase [Atopostipes suicloacalis DSM 15692]
MKAEKILFDAYNPYIVNLAEFEIKNIQTNSRLIEAGDLFVAIKGHTVDGHQFIEQAIQQGAHLVLANKSFQKITDSKSLLQGKILFVDNTYHYLSTVMNRFLDYPSQKMNIFGITGTNGKTSTANILIQILTKTSQKSAVLGTTGIRTQNYSAPLNNTTPDPLILQNVFHQMVELEVKNMIMEVSSIGLSENRTKETDFSVAIFTNFSQDHLDFHGSMENYLEAKGKFFKELEPYNSRGLENFAIINRDDDAADYFIEQSKAAVLTYGLDSSADYYASDCAYSEFDTKFTLHHNQKTYSVQSSLIGEFNVYNTLAAIAAAHSQGIALPKIIAELKNLSSADGRLEVVSDTTKDEITAIVDFAHTPDSLEKALQTLAHINHRRIISVFGCGGDRDASKRPIMAKIGVTNSDHVIFTSDNPRTENPERILEEMTNELTEENYCQIVSRKEAIQHAINLAEKDDIVLIAGKGHEDYQIIGTEKYPFDDSKCVKEALEIKNKHSKIDLNS